MSFRLFLTMVLLGVMPAAPADAVLVTVFSTDFDSGIPAGFSGAGTAEPVQGYTAAGLSGQMLRNTAVGDPAGASVLTLTNLPPHTSLSVAFLLAAVDSWDGTKPVSTAPDFFNVAIDGTSQLQWSIHNVQNPQPQNQNAPLAQRVGFGEYGFDALPDAAYQVSLSSIPHTAATAQITFFASGSGWQGGTDESFGIDDLTVQVAVIPEPSMTVGLAVLSVVCFRRSRFRLRRA